ncbi:hypothetical protein Q8G35_12370 [Peribacillus simplex]|uniref:Uncharacterized protein n=2 Tax=Peribacillus TaxID=2675229 RepID=A0AA90SKS8_9BACI|nr:MULTISPECIES: hypothetical protein [Peribacillus]MDP1419206.1 hypothetical protein [Peribacillus simplex]MDP1452156.1 hypothetical protein [Peribacillus frigoritolerans]
MTTQTIEATKVYVSIDNAAQWIVLEEQMLAGFNYQLASIEDLHDYVSATGEFFTYNVETAEGVAKWHTEDYPEESPNDYVCEYRVIN